jgi:hypothetical protein
MLNGSSVIFITSLPGPLLPGPSFLLQPASKIAAAKIEKIIFFIVPVIIDSGQK